MKDNQTEQTEIERITRFALDESALDLSPEVQDKLSLARAQALEHTKPKQLQIHGVWTWGGAIAACLMIAVILIPLSEDDTDTAPFISNNTNNDLLLLSEITDEDMEIIEDLEFAYWLSQNEELIDETDSPTRS